MGRALRFCVEQLFPLMKHKIGVLPILPEGIVIKAVFLFHSHVLKFGQPKNIPPACYKLYISVVDSSPSMEED